MMRTCLLVILLTLIIMESAAQAGDFIVIRKKNRSVTSILKGSVARFYTTTGEAIEARVSDIKNDSIYFREILLQRIPTQWGVYRVDTVATPQRQIHYNEIAAIPRRNEAFSYIKNGSIFMIGGAGYILLQVVNGAYLNYPPFGEKNRAGILTALGVFTGGFVLSKLRKPVITIGRRYSIHYINLESR